MVSSCRLGGRKRDSLGRQRVLSRCATGFGAGPSANAPRKSNHPVVCGRQTRPDDDSRRLHARAMGTRSGGLGDVACPDRSRCADDCLRAAADLLHGCRGRALERRANAQPNRGESTHVGAGPERPHTGSPSSGDAPNSHYRDGHGERIHQTGAACVDGCQGRRPGRPARLSRFAGPTPQGGPTASN